MDYLDDDKDFGARLRAERERLGLELHELAHLCGCTDFTQRRYEAGEQPIPIDYLHCLDARTEINWTLIVRGGN